MILTMQIKQEITRQEEMLDFSVGEDRKDWMAEKLSTFISEASAKFIRGQREHGRNIEDRDLFIEMQAEIMDMFWYNVSNREKDINKEQLYLEQGR